MNDTDEKRNDSLLKVKNVAFSFTNFIEKAAFFVPLSTTYLFIYIISIDLDLGV